MSSPFPGSDKPSPDAASIKEQEESRSALLFMLEDLEHARKQIEQAHQEWMAALDAVDDPIFLHDNDSRILRANRAYQRQAGLRFSEIIGKRYYDIFPRVAGPLPTCQVASKNKTACEEEITVGDRIYRSRVSPVLDEQDQLLYSVHSLEDITEHEQMEYRMALENRRMQASLQLGGMIGAREQEILDFALAQGVALSGSQYGFISRMNADATAMSIQAWSKEVLPACAIQQAPIEFPIAQAGLWAEPLRQRQPCIVNDYGAAHPKKHGIPSGHVAIRRYLGVPVFEGANIVMIAAVANKEQEYNEADAAALSALMTDVWRIMLRNQAEHALLRSNRALRTISAGNQTLIHAEDEIDLLQEICRVATETGGYSAAWVGYAQHDAEKSVHVMAHSGFEAGYADTMQITWTDSERGRGPTGKALRSGQIQVLGNVAADPDCAPWHDQAMKRGYASCIALPLRDGANVFGTLTIYTAEMNAFDQDEIKLLEEMAGDLAYGIVTLRIKQAHQTHEQRLQKNMLQTIKAIAGIVEMRDPYTSGHQARVADLARAIARRLNLEGDEQQAIHLAGLVHDLGKVRIPAEILSKPGRLNEVEFSLIKMHSQAGYDILQGIDFSWPIAQMVWQHHERMDGSGYPQGLKGDSILPGARILCVADVTEAMASHRPYRPGLGIDAALEELQRGCGTVYDEKVVDACITLFRKEGYAFNK